MVAEGFWVLPALPSLTVELQEVRDHGQCCPGAVATLQSQPVEGIRRSVFVGKKTGLCQLDPNLATLQANSRFYADWTFNTGSEQPGLQIKA